MSEETDWCSRQQSRYKHLQTINRPAVPPDHCHPEKSMSRRFLALIPLICGLATISIRGLDARGIIQIQGSDTLVPVAVAWAERFHQTHADIAIAVTGGGTTTGIAALLDRTVDLANASREIKPAELEQGQQRQVSPVAHVVGFDSLAVFVHKDNPLNAISIQELSEIYGEKGTLHHWSQLGVEVPGCVDQKLVSLNRHRASGTRTYFRQKVLGEDRSFFPGSRDLPNSNDVIERLAETPCAIGYSGLAYDTPRVKMLKIAHMKGDTPVAASAENALNNSYPITRPLFIYSNGPPQGDIKTYLDWILGQEGQCLIRARGYAPVRPVECR